MTDLDADLDLIIAITDTLREYMSNLPGNSWGSNDAPDFALAVVNDLHERGLLDGAEVRRLRAENEQLRAHVPDDLPDWMTEPDRS